MIAIAELVTILLLVITVLLQSLDIRLRYTDHLSIVFSLTFFSLTISHLTNVRRKRKHRLSTMLRISAFMTRLVHDLLPRCTVVAHSIKPFALSDTAEPRKIIATSILSPTLLSYIKSGAMAYHKLGDTGDRLDITFSFSLAALFISLLKASYYTVKSKQRGIRNAR